MNVRRSLTAFVLMVLLAGVGAVLFTTRDRWLPRLFPQAEPLAGTPVEDPHDHDHGDRVTLSAQAQANLGLIVDLPEPSEYWRTILIPGKIIDRPGESDRVITSRVAGIVSEIRAKPGDSIAPGQLLFSLQLTSEFLQSAQADLVKSSRELEFSIARRDRVATQVSQGTQSGTVLIEEENQVKRFTTQVQSYRRQLSLFGFSSEQVDRAAKGDIVTELSISAPGTRNQVYEFQELKVNLGDQVQAGQILGVLANHQKLYIEGRAFKSEAELLARAIEEQVDVNVEIVDERSGNWKPQEPLKIRHLANEVETTSRTFGFYLPLDNQSRILTQNGSQQFIWRYRPGQRVRLRIPVESIATRSAENQTPTMPFVLPVAAVVRDGPEAYVFVQSGDVFIRKPVHILHESRTDVVVANDGSISEVDFVVRNQAAAILRALKALQSEGGGHHGHDHDH